MNSNLRQTSRGSDEILSRILLSMQIVFSAGSWIASFSGMADNPTSLMLCTSIIGAVVFLTVTTCAIVFKRGVWIAAVSAFVLSLPLLYIIVVIAVFGLGWTNC